MLGFSALGQTALGELLEVEAVADAITVSTWTANINLTGAGYASALGDTLAAAGYANTANTGLTGAGYANALADTLTGTGYANTANTGLSGAGYALALGDTLTTQES